MTGVMGTDPHAANLEQIRRGIVDAWQRKRLADLEGRHDTARALGKWIDMLLDRVPLRLD